MYTCQGDSFRDKKRESVTVEDVLLKLPQFIGAIFFYLLTLQVRSHSPKEYALSTPPLRNKCVSAATAVTLAMGLVPSAAFAEVNNRATEAAQQQQPGIEATVDGQQQETANDENADTNKGTGNENGSSASEKEKAEGTADGEKAAGNGAENSSQSEAAQQPAEQAADAAAANAIATYSDGGTLSYHNGELTKKMMRSFLVDSFNGSSTSTFRIKQASESEWTRVDGTWTWPQGDQLLDYSNGMYSVQIYKQVGTKLGTVPVYDFVDCGTFTLQRQFNINDITINGCETGALQVNGTDIAAPYAVDEGADFNFTIKTVEDFKVDSVTVDGNAILPNETGVYTITNMGSDKSIVATYKADNEATLTANFSNATVKAYGTELTSGTPQTVASGKDGNAVVEPAEGYAVTSIKLGITELIDGAVFSNHVAAVPLGELEKDSQNTLTVTTAKSELATKSDKVGIAGLDKSEYAQRVFRDIVDTNKTVPADLTSDKVTIEYNASDYATVWEDLAYEPGFIEKAYRHAFGESKSGSETIRISYAGNPQYPGWEQELTISFADTRLASKIFMNSSCTLYYADEATMKENLFDLLQPSVQGEDGKLLTGLTKDDFEFEDFPTDLGEYTMKVKFKGNKEYKESEFAEATVTVVKGKSSLTINSKSIDYGTEIGIDDLVSTTPGNAETKPITVIVGIDGTASGFIGIDFGDITLKDVAGDKVPSIFKDTSLQAWITSTIGNEFKVSELNSKIDQITALLEAMGVPETSSIISALHSISSMLNSIPGISNSTVRIGATPSNAGVYLVGAATASAKYETSVGMGYITIAPDATNASLEFVDKIGADVRLTVPKAKSLNYSAQVNGIGSDSADMLVTFAGVTDDGKSYLKTTTVKSNDANMEGKLSDIAPKVPGLYTQTVFSIGNYSASPISRAYTVNYIGTTVEVTDSTTAYNGNPQQADPSSFTVCDEDGKVIQGAEVEVHYSGTSYNGTVYDHTDSVTEAGEYAVEASYNGSEDYAKSTGSGKFTVAKAPTFIVPTIPASAVYSGDPQGASATVYREGTEETIGTASVIYTGINGTEYGPTTDAPVNAGTYSVTAKYEGTGNFLPSSLDEGTTFTIAKAKTKVGLSVPTDAIYESGKQWEATAKAYVDKENGQAIEDVPVTYTGKQNDGTTYGPTDVPPSFAGTYQASATYEGSNNYESSGAEETFRIAPQQVFIHIPNYVVFEGEDEPEFTATVGKYDSNGTFVPFDNQDWWIQELGLVVDKLENSGFLNGQENVYALDFFYTNEANYQAELYNPHTGEVEDASCAILPSLTVTADEHGAAAAFEKTGEPAKGGAAGTELNLTATAEDGYEFAGWVVESGDATIADTKAANTTLAMGEKSSTVKATFAKKEQPTPPVDPSNPSDPSTPAADNNGNNNQANSNAQANKEQAKSAVQTGDNSLVPIALGFAGAAAAVALAALIMMMRRRRS